MAVLIRIIEMLHRTSFMKPHLVQDQILKSDLPKRIMLELTNYVKCLLVILADCGQHEWNGIKNNGKIQMNEKVYVLCSKYSESCQKFMNIVSQFGIDIIYPIYIDSQEARDIILSSPLKIKSVPCILGTVNGFFATYEGKDAFDWLNEISKNYIATPSPEEEIVPSENMNALAENKLTD